MTLEPPMARPGASLASCSSATPSTPPAPASGTLRLRTRPSPSPSARTPRRRSTACPAPGCGTPLGQAALAMGGRVIQTPLSMFSMGNTIEIITKRRLTDSAAPMARRRWLKQPPCQRRAGLRGWEAVRGVRLRARRPGGGGAVVGLYPIVSFQYSSINLYQVSCHIQYSFFF